MLRNKLQYLSDKCSLQWLGYVFTPMPSPLFKRLFWLATIMACCIGSAVVLRGALLLYTSDAVSYSVETDYLEWDTPFPALTVCEQMKEERIEKYLQTRNYPSGLATFIKEVSFWNPKFCRSCTVCKINETCINNFLGLVENIRLKCTDLLTECWWDGKAFPCCERFRLITTEYGPCYVFNSRLTGNESILTVNRRNRLPSLVFSAIHGINIRIHSSDDVISVASENMLNRACSSLPLVSDFAIILKAEQTTSDVSVQPLSPDSRDCLFRHERPAFAHLWPFKRYSYSACEMYCRAITQAEVCNCTHHFMPQIGDIPKCGIDGLACLHKVKSGKLNTDHFHCPMACEEVTYKFSYVTCPREISKTNRSTRGHLHLGSLPTLRVRRHAIRELLGLVGGLLITTILLICQSLHHGMKLCSCKYKAYAGTKKKNGIYDIGTTPSRQVDLDIGGVIGVFFGASLLSFIEIIYILFIRKYP